MLQRKYSHNKNILIKEQSQQLDFQYLQLRQSILSSQFLKNHQKHIKIRIKLWMNKLDQIITNPTWKKNRNNYAKIINLMCQCEVVVEPFSSMPPQADIPKLSKAEINKLIDQIERFVKLQKSKVSNAQVQYQQRNETLRPYEYWQNIKSMRVMAKEKDSPKDETIEDSNIAFSKLQEFNQKLKLKDSRQLQNKLKQSLFFLQETHSLKEIIQKVNKQNKSNYNIKDDGLQMKKKQNQNKPQPKYPRKVSIKIQKLQHFKKSAGIKQSVKSIDNMSNVKNINSCLISSKQTDPNNDNLEAYRDNHQSFSMQNHTLKTQYFDNDQQHNQQHKHQNHSSQSSCQYNFNQDIVEEFKEKDQILSHNYFGWKNKGDNIITKKQLIESSNDQTKFMKAKRIGELSCNPPIKRCPSEYSHIESIDDKNGEQMMERGIRQSIDNSCQVYEGQSNISLTTESCGEQQSGLKDITNILIKNKFK